MAAAHPLGGSSSPREYAGTDLLFWTRPFDWGGLLYMQAIESRESDEEILVAIRALMKEVEDGADS